MGVRSGAVQTRFKYNFGPDQNCTSAENKNQSTVKRVVDNKIDGRFTQWEAGNKIFTNPSSWEIRA